MSRIHVAFAVLFIISTVSAQGSKLQNSDIDINNQTFSVPITEINSKGTDPTSTTQPTPTTNSTTIEPTTTEKPTSTLAPNHTSTTPPPTTTSTSTIVPPSTTVSTTVKPTGAPPTTPVPSHRRFDGPSFIGGIVLALGLVAIGFVAFKFYKARTELNYHTL